MSSRRQRQPHAVPGFGLSLGYTIAYLSIVVLLPLTALVAKASSMGWTKFRATVFEPDVMGAYRLTIGASALAAIVNMFVGLLIAWVLSRYAFPGRRLMDALIDLPFALPTAVAGIALSFLYGRGWIGQLIRSSGLHYPWPTWHGFAAGHWLIEWAWYDRITRAPLGIVVALMFVGLPFVIRTVQPVLMDLSREVEEAAQSLGANRWQTFRRVILPQVMPALITGFTLAFARGLGEYGSVIFIAGKQRDTEITAHKIVELIELDDTYAQPTAVAAVLLVISFALLLSINVFQRWTASRTGDGK